MLKNLDQRTQYWTKFKTVKMQGATPWVPFKRHKHYFRNRHVLEIGPGDGRQARVLRKLASRYEIADITPEVLEQYEPSHRICDYTETFGAFEVITFWYVLHHVLEAEQDLFMEFLKRNLAEGGVLAFNSPEEGQTDDMGREPGCGTSPVFPGDVRVLLDKHALHVVGSAAVEASVPKRSRKRICHSLHADRIHVRIEHEGSSAATTLQGSEYAWAARFMLDGFGLEPELHERRGHEPRDFPFSRARRIERGIDRLGLDQSNQHVTDVVVVDGNRHSAKIAAKRTRTVPFRPPNNAWPHPLANLPELP